jgi:hypothetical protein
MIVYRDQLLRADPQALLEKLRTRVTRLDFLTATVHQAVLDAFIEAGILESAVADAVFSEADGIHPLTSDLRGVTVGLGHVLWHCWLNAPQRAKQWCSRVLERLGDIQRHRMPPNVEFTVPEGFAYYAVYPEGYLEAARQFWAELRPSNTVCIGLRSIGTTLSGGVAAALSELGCPTQSLTIRPRGHPFSRTPIFDWQVEQLIRGALDAHFLLVDEGPGISGSSLAGTAQLLGSLGVPDDRIILFPSWQTDGSQLRSAEARDHWSRHRQFSVSFEELWIDSGKLRRALPGWQWQELSAGAWRSEVYDDPHQYPPVQPQHERRKYLLRPDSGRYAPGKLLSFTGLGDRTEPLIHRGERLAEAGFTPWPEGKVHGFLIRQFVPGSPGWAGGVDESFVETVARYLAHLSRQHISEPTTSTASLKEMARLNVAEELGSAWEQRLEAALPCESETWSERPVTLDGRMQPHEWIRTDCGYIKVDAFDHHSDHFFAGCQDIAWDLSAAAFEMQLDTAARRCLIERYRKLSGDHSIGARLPHYGLCYLAYRLGYTRLATTVLGESADKQRFATAADRYSQLLRRELRYSPGATWND